MSAAQTFEEMQRMAAEYQNWSVGVMSQPEPGGESVLRYVAIFHRTHYSQPGLEKGNSGRVTVGFIAEADSLAELEKQMRNMEAEKETGG